MLPNYDLVPYAKNSRKHFSSHVVVEQKKKINLLTQKSFQRGKPPVPTASLQPYKTCGATAGGLHTPRPPQTSADSTRAVAAPEQVTQPRENRGVAGRALLAWAGGR